MQDPTPWQSYWQQGHTPWDLGGPHPGMPRLLAMVAEVGCLPSSGSAYVPGCGRGHEARFLANQLCWRGRANQSEPEALPESEWQVVGEDITPEAISAAQAAGTSPGLSFRIGDALQCPPAEEGRFDLICDRAMLCALPPTLRADYQRACWQRLRPGGVFAGIIFSLGNPESQPPYGIAIEDLAAALQPAFGLLAVEHALSGTSRQRQPSFEEASREYYAVFRKAAVWEPQ